MKKLLFALLLLPSLAWGQEYARMNPYILGAGGSAAAAPSTFCSSATASQSITGLLCEDIGSTTDCDAGAGEDLSCRGTWTISAGTPDFSYRTSPAPIEGSDSFFLGGCVNAADTRIYRDFTATADQPQELYFEFILTEDGSTPGTFYLAALARAASVYCDLTINSNKTLKVTAGGGTGQSTVGTISEDVKTYVFLRYLKGTGADAVCTVGFSTDGTRPTSGDNYKESTNGTATLDATRVYLYGEYTSANTCQDVIFDKILVDDATIPSNPT